CFLMRRPHTTSTLFPYTTLFRSDHRQVAEDAAALGHVGNTELRDLVGGAAGHVLAHHLHRAGAWLDQPHQRLEQRALAHAVAAQDRKSTRLNSSHSQISYAVFCL